jgi:hypothetical protein
MDPRSLQPGRRCRSGDPEDGTAFELPENAIVAWVMALSRKSILMPSSGGERWLLHRMVVDAVGDLRHRRTLPGLRQTELRKAVADILNEIPVTELASFSFEDWFGRPLPEFYMNAGHPALRGKSPSAFCVDQATMRKCAELTPTAGKRRR